MSASNRTHIIIYIYIRIVCFQQRILWKQSIAIAGGEREIVAAAIGNSGQALEFAAISLHHQPEVTLVSNGEASLASKG